MADKLLGQLTLPEVRMVLREVAWETYDALSDQRDGRTPRMTYDRGILEMMSPAREHENIGRLLGRLIETYSEVHDIEIISVASMTVKHSGLSKGFEPDESYYVTHAAQVLGKKDMDFEVDPPPDLIVEVELTSSAIKKMDLFAAMKVPEVWRHDGKNLSMYRLVDNQYQSILSSVELPGLVSERINATMGLRNSTGETKLIKEFRKSIID
ncbi:Uma2 family endonuclease [Pirellulaceae bacterium SH449]